MSKENESQTPRLDQAIKEMGLQPVVLAGPQGWPLGAEELVKKSYAVNEVSTAPRQPR